MTTSRPKKVPERLYAGQELAVRVKQRRQQFIDAGIEQFGTVGYHATTVRTITAAAGLSNRYFYESFPTMEDLLMACYQQLTDDYRRRLATVLTEAPEELEPRVRAGLRCYFEQLRNPHYARITLVEVLGVSTQVDALYVRSIREFGKLIAENIARFGAPTDAVSKRELEIVGVALAGSLTTTGGLWMRTRYRDSIDTLLEATLHIVIGTARHLMASR